MDSARKNRAPMRSLLNAKSFSSRDRPDHPPHTLLNYKTQTAETFEFNTDVDGNRNSGHEYGTALSDDEKWAIIEFMKTAMGPVG